MLPGAPLGEVLEPTPGVLEPPWVLVGPLNSLNGRCGEFGVDLGQFAGESLLPKDHQIRPKSTESVFKRYSQTC